MKRCPITYEPVPDDALYSVKGLRMLSPRLARLDPLPLTGEEQRIEALARADKMSIQGVQPKLSAVLNASAGRFEIVDRGGKYILKPQIEYPEVPQNEALTMTLAETIGLDVPLHGLLYSKGGDFTYFIKRFDREGRRGKVPLEDFAQLSGASRETKYSSSMEEIAKIVARFCTFPIVENVKLFRLTLFCFLTGNEDMHLKNFSLIRREGKVEISPMYDLLNSTIALPNPSEELALPLNGKKSNLRRDDFIDRFGMDRLGLNAKIVDEVLDDISAAIPGWKDLIGKSFLSQAMKTRYQDLLQERFARMLPA